VKKSLITPRSNSENIINSVKKCSNSSGEDGVIIYDIPDKIEGTYKDNYNIVNVDDIIRKKLRQEKYKHLENLKAKYKNLEIMSLTPQNYVARETTINSMNAIQKEIDNIEIGEKLRIYDEKTRDLIKEYKKYNGLIKTVSFDNNTEDDYIYDEKTFEKFRNRIIIIEKYLEIASLYINVSIIKINAPSKEICCGCGGSLAKIPPSDDGFVRCPEEDCQTENIVIVQNKIIKEGVYSTNNATESIDNFMKAFMYYQGLQNVKLPDNLFIKLDEYFRKIKRPTGEEIMKLPLTSRGRRGDTDHKMIWSALSAIGYPEHYKHSNYICHKYWGWELPNVMHLKDIITYHYNVTEKIYKDIPVSERQRDSSLGIPYRLWRHLQLAGHECYSHEFKIVTNTDSLNCHDRLWKRMTEEANLIDPSIYYIP
jgi:hypothetical protein